MVRLPKLDMGRGQSTDDRPAASSRLFGGFRGSRATSSRPPEEDSYLSSAMKTTVGIGSAAISRTHQTVSAAAALPVKAAVVARDCSSFAAHGAMGVANGVMDAAVALPVGIASSVLETSKGAAFGVIECSQRVTSVASAAITLPVQAGEGRKFVVDTLSQPVHHMTGLIGAVARVNRCSKSLDDRSRIRRPVLSELETSDSR